MTVSRALIDSAQVELIDPLVRVLVGDCMDRLDDVAEGSVQCAVTSPPYLGLRDYGLKARDWPEVTYRPAWDLEPITVPAMRCVLGLEPDVRSFIGHLVLVFRKVWRALRPDGTLWLNLGGSFATGTNAKRNASIERAGQSKPASWTNRNEATRRSPEGLAAKQFIPTPWRLAMALQADGWILRCEIVWCLSGGATVYARTQKGDAPATVKDLVRLDPSTVKLWNGEKWTQVLGWGPSHDTSQRLELVLRSGERIGCTGGHEWPTQRGNVRARDLQVGDVLATCTLPEPDGAVAPGFLTLDVAWFLGLYLAEGCRRDDKVQLSLNADEVGWLPRIEAVAHHLGGTMTHSFAGKCMIVRLHGKMIAAAVASFIGGDEARDKHLHSTTWRLPNEYLRAIIQGYLDGDGHADKKTDRWRIGCARNSGLERDLRTAAARLGATLTLRMSTATCQTGTFPSMRGEWRWTRSGHHNEKKRSEIIEIRAGRGRQYWDIAVEDEPHLFALASGVLTHNCKKSPMPECVTDRPTIAHEPLFLFSKQGKYFYDKVGASEPLEHSEASKPADLARAWSDRRANVVDPHQPPAKPYGSRNKRGVTGHERGRPGDHRKASVPWIDTTGRRNARDVWWLASEPFKGAHTATFPSELVRRCLRAGVSEKGACSSCGAPWRRRVEKTFVPQEDVSPERGVRGAAGQKHLDATNGREGFPRGKTITRTIGWEPACACGAGRPVPCVVLDPFGGTGTVGSVAKERGLEALLCEAQPDYVPLIVRRVGRAPTYQPPLVEDVITLLVEDDVESDEVEPITELPRAQQSGAEEPAQRLLGFA